MRRKLFIFCAIMSAVLWIGFVAMWIRSYRVYDHVRYKRGEAVTGQKNCILCSSSGGFSLMIGRSWSTAPSKDKPPGLYWSTVPVQGPLFGYPIFDGPGKLYGPESLPVRLGFQIQNYHGGKPGVW